MRAQQTGTGTLFAGRSDVRVVELRWRSGVVVAAWRWEDGIPVAEWRRAIGGKTEGPTLT